MLKFGLLAEQAKATEQELKSKGSLASCIPLEAKGSGHCGSLDIEAMFCGLADVLHGHEWATKGIFVLS